MKHIAGPWRRLRRRFGAATAAAIVALAVCATAALAYYAIVYTGASGSNNQNAASSGGTSGSATALTLLPLWGSQYPAGAQPALAPGVTDSLWIGVTNNDPSAIHTLTGLTATVTTSNPSTCLASWFTVTLPSSTNYESSAFAVGASDMPLTSNGNDGTIAFVNDPLSQAACEGSDITVTLTGTTNP